MIDTVVLNIEYPNFNIVLPWNFQPDTRGLFQEPFISFPAGQHYISCIQNPSKSDIENGIYKPRLTVIKRRGNKIHLRIELSLPKLIYGNNFDELDDSDFNLVINRLRLILLKMGVMINEEYLKQASVSTIHYGKNIVFTDYTFASSVINLISKANVTKRLDLNLTDYRNAGEAIRHHSDTFQVLLYDKIAELNKSKARAIEKEDREYNNYQLDLFNEIRKNEHPLEVLRIEFRLIKKPTIKRHFKRMQIESDFTFQSLFKKEIAQRLLIDYWNKTYEELKPVLLQDLTFAEQFELLAKQNSSIQPQKTLKMLALSILIKEVGYRKTRALFDQHFSYKSMQRIYEDIKSLEYNIMNKVTPINKITNDLKEFKSLKMKEFDYFQTN